MFESLQEPSRGVEDRRSDGETKRTKALTRRGVTNV